MKLLIYCQHVLGVGHFFRTLEIAKTFASHTVILVTGGGDIPVQLPGFIQNVCLPGLMMNKDFSAMHSLVPGKTVTQVKEERKIILWNLFDREKPDLFLVELYPFGRKAFRFELDPLLEKIRTEKNRGDKCCKVVCSLRDILVEKTDPAAYENRVTQTLNRYFDALLVHSDPDAVRLTSCFSSMAAIQIPVVYTGFVTPFPDPAKRDGIRNSLGVTPTEVLVVVSAGGGNVGVELLVAACQAHKLLENRTRVKMLLITGPYMDTREIYQIKAAETEDIQVIEFYQEFVSLLHAADLSISMGGYNTLMNCLAARVPALIMPFDQNREQRMRLNRLHSYGELFELEKQELAPIALARRIQERLDKPSHAPPDLPDLTGAAKTHDWVKERFFS
jgi:predicted glycosyltransferase